MAALHAVLSGRGALRWVEALTSCPLKALRFSDRQGAEADALPRTLCIHLVGADDVPTHCDVIFAAQYSTLSCLISQLNVIHLTIAVATHPWSAGLLWVWGRARYDNGRGVFCKVLHPNPAVFWTTDDLLSCSLVPDTNQFAAYKLASTV